MHELLNELNVTLGVKKAEMSRHKESAESLAHQIEQGREKSTSLLKSAEVLKKLVESRRSSVCDTLAIIGTSALQYALQDDNIEMKITEKDYRDSISSDVRIVNKETGLETPIRGAKGGGISDIVNTAIRIGIIKSFRDPAIDGPIILDEPYKQLSSEYQPAIAAFLSRITTDFDRQIILSTHNDFIRESGGKKICVKSAGADTSQIVVEGGDAQ